MILPQNNKTKDGGVKPPLQLDMLKPTAADRGATGYRLDRLKPVPLKPSDLG
jgi:hypothetical protein